MLMIYVRKYNYIIMLSYVFFLFSFPALSLSLFHRRLLKRNLFYYFYAVLILFRRVAGTRKREENFAVRSI